MNEVRHISIFIDRKPDEVYRFVSNPENLPKWAQGLSGSIAFENGEWIAGSPMGRIKIRFAEKNIFGVLDHEVELESGMTFNNPMRVVANGEGSEVTFTLFRQPEMGDAKFEEDAKMITSDFAALKGLLE